MSAFSSEDVRRLAALARLEIDAGETEAFARQLAEILDFARQIDAVDTTSLDGAGAMIPPHAAPRPDVLEPSLPRETVLSAAPDGDPATGLLKVPRVFNG
jgi:aspartyl-tRNA(Asn)/glutamyl-tRNA(Gln) amidotransferase subunit C